MNARMMRGVTLLILVLALLGGTWGAGAQVIENRVQEPVPEPVAFKAGELLVRFRPDVTAETESAI